MALFLHTGFETGEFTAEALSNYTATIQNTLKHTGEYALHCNGNQQYVGFNNDIARCSFWIYFDANPGSNFVLFGSVGIRLYALTDRKIALYNGTTLLATSTNACKLDDWSRVSFGCDGANVKVYIDGSIEINYADTSSHIDGYLGIITNVTSADIYLDDIGCASDASSEDLGDIRVTASVPSAAGDSTQLTAFGAAQNYQCVGDIPVNLNTMASGANSTFLDLYHIQSMATLGLGSCTAQAVSVVMDAKRVSTVSASGMVQDNGLLTGASKSITTSPAWYSIYYATTPSGGAAWTNDRFNNLQIGFRITTTATSCIGCLFEEYAMVAYLASTTQALTQACNDGVLGSDSPGVMRFQTIFKSNADSLTLSSTHPLRIAKSGVASSILAPVVQAARLKVRSLVEGAAVLGNLLRRKYNLLSGSTVAQVSSLRAMRTARGENIFSLGSQVASRMGAKVQTVLEGLAIVGTLVKRKANFPLDKVTSLSGVQVLKSGVVILSEKVILKVLPWWIYLRGALTGAAKASSQATRGKVFAKAFAGAMRTTSVLTRASVRKLAAYIVQASSFYKPFTKVFSMSLAVLDIVRKSKRSTFAEAFTPGGLLGAFSRIRVVYEYAKASGSLLRAVRGVRRESTLLAERAILPRARVVFDNLYASLVLRRKPQRLRVEKVSLIIIPWWVYLRGALADLSKSSSGVTFLKAQMKHLAEYVRGQAIAFRCKAFVLRQAIVATTMGYRLRNVVLPHILTARLKETLVWTVREAQPVVSSADLAVALVHNTVKLYLTYLADAVVTQAQQTFIAFKVLSANYSTFLGLIFHRDGVLLIFKELSDTVSMGLQRSFSIVATLKGENVLLPSSLLLGTVRNILDAITSTWAEKRVWELIRLDGILFWSALRRDNLAALLENILLGVSLQRSGIYRWFVDAFAAHEVGTVIRGMVRAITDSLAVLAGSVAQRTLLNKLLTLTEGILISLVVRRGRTVLVGALALVNAVSMQRPLRRLAENIRLAHPAWWVYLRPELTSPYKASSVMNILKSKLETFLEGIHVTAGLQRSLLRTWGEQVAMVATGFKSVFRPVKDWVQVAPLPVVLSLLGRVLGEVVSTISISMRGVKHFCSDIMQEQLTWGHFISHQVSAWVISQATVFTPRVLVLDIFQPVVSLTKVSLLVPLVRAENAILQTGVVRFASVLRVQLTSISTALATTIRGLPGFILVETVRAGSAVRGIVNKSLREVIAEHLTWLYRSQRQGYRSIYIAMPVYSINFGSTESSVEIVLPEYRVVFP